VISNSCQVQFFELAYILPINVQKRAVRRTEEHATRDPYPIPLTEVILNTLRQWFAGAPKNMSEQVLRSTSHFLYRSAADPLLVVAAYPLPRLFLAFPFSLPFLAVGFGAETEGPAETTLAESMR